MWILTDDINGGVLFKFDSPSTLFISEKDADTYQIRWGTMPLCEPMAIEKCRWLMRDIGIDLGIGAKFYSVADWLANHRIVVE